MKCVCGYEGVADFDFEKMVLHDHENFLDEDGWPTHIRHEVIVCACPRCGTLKIETGER
jgi:hypothetical protein